MMPKELMPADLSEAVEELRDRDEPFAFATIVRTAGATSAKPGAKAILGADGTIIQGFLGGGCTRGAVRKAALEAIRTGVPRLISVAPEEMLSEQGVAPGDEVAGVVFARNGCPSRGSVDIFIEPCLPLPQLALFGASPVAHALTELAPRFQWDVLRAAPHQDILAVSTPRRRVIIVATQGQGDLGALKAALSCGAEYVAFVGSRRKYATLAEKLETAGLSTEAVQSVRAPAGLDIGAVTPEEIALSILAELTRVRRNPKTRDTQ